MRRTGSTRGNAKAVVKTICQAVILLASSMMPASVAAAGTEKGSEPTLVSQPDALPDDGTTGSCGSAEGFQEWDNEPTLVATGHESLVTAWTQDFSDAITVAYSDNGRSWTQVLPQTTACTGPLGLDGFNSAYDPWLSVGARSSNPALDRIVYLSSALRAPGEVTPVGTTVVNRSLDGGRTWSAPVEVGERVTGSHYVEGSTITADPHQAGVAYVTWRRGDWTFTTRDQYLAKTSDGGVTWSEPVALPDVALPAAGNLVVLPDGTLIDVFVEVPPQPGFVLSNTNGPTIIRATRSSNGGASWSEPELVAVADERLMVMVGIAVTPNGTLLVSWQRASTDPLISPSVSLMLTSSKDAGRSWTTPRSAGPAIPGLPAFSAHGTIASAPSLAVAANGTIGLGFYDHRNDLPATSPPSVTDFWFRSSSDGGKSWTERHLAGRFDQTTAPSDDGPTCNFFTNLVTSEDEQLREQVREQVPCPGVLGDSQGIVGRAHGFALTYALAAPLAVHGPTDIFYSDVRP